MLLPSTAKIERRETALRVSIGSHQTIRAEEEIYKQNGEALNKIRIRFERKNMIVSWVAFMRNRGSNVST